MRLRAQTPGGSSVCRIAMHGLDLGARRAEFLGDGVEIAAEVAGFVHHVDQVLPDHAASRIGDRQRHLFGKMSGQRDFGGDEGFQIVVALRTALAACARPFRIGRRRGFRRRAFFAAVVRENIFEFGAEPLFHGATAGFHVLADPVGGGRGSSPPSALSDAGAFRLGGHGRRVVAVAGALQQRVFFQFRVDVSRKVEAGELQQLDGLHQLRRHHQGLGLAELESL